MSGPAPVTDGVPEEGFPAVAALIDADDFAGCTATLIGPHTLLTAAHCVAGIDARELRAFFGSAVAGGGTTIDISEARVHPDFEGPMSGNDVAVLTIRADAAAVPIALDARDVDASFVGTTFRVVGFGFTSGGADDGGVKRSGTAQVSEVTALELTVIPAPSQPCAGDSGGPALFDDGGTTVVTGVVSYGDTPCAEFAVYGRVDVARDDFIAPYLTEHAPGSVATGEACLYEGHCADGACLQTADDARLWFCTEACDGDADCPEAMACVDDLCRYPLPSPGAIGADCASPAACASGVCHDGACSLECLSAEVECPVGFVCEPAGGLDYFCVAEPPTGCCAASPGGGASTLVVLMAIALARRIGRRASPRDTRRRRTARTR